MKGRREKQRKKDEKEKRKYIKKDEKEKRKEGKKVERKQGRMNGGLEDRKILKERKKEKKRRKGRKGGKGLFNKRKKGRNKNREK